MTLSRPHHCVAGEMQPGCDGGSCLPRPLIAWWLVQSYRGIEGQWLTDYLWVHVRIYVNVAMILWGFGGTSHNCLFSCNSLHFNGNSRCSVHTNKDISVCRFKTFFTPTGEVCRSWKSKTVFIMFTETHIGFNCLVQKVEGRHCHLWLCLSLTCSPLGFFFPHREGITRVSPQNKLQRLNPSIWNLDIVELISGMQSGTDWEGMM